MIRQFGLASMAAVLVLGAHAQSDSQPGPCDAEPYQAFDFWLGAWRVTDPAGELAGSSTITKQENGCLLVERWESARGTTGQSYNYFDPGTEMWRQVWISPDVVIDYEGGPNQRGHMLLEGTIKYRNGDTHPFRGNWVPNANGTVTQHFEQYDEGEERWEDWFIGTYRKK